MKKILLSLLIIGAGVFVTSCGGDDEKFIEGGELTYDGVTYDLADGYVEDYGAGSTHYNYDFDIYDAAEDVYIYFEAYSLGTDAFKGGTYVWGDDTDTTPDENYFDYDSYISIWDSQNQVYIVDEYITAGTVTIKDLGDYKFKITFSVTLENGKTATGSFSSTYAYTDRSGVRLKK